MFTQELDWLFDDTNLLQLLKDYYINPSLLISDSSSAVGIYDSESNQYWQCIKLEKRSKILIALPDNKVVVQQNNTLQIWSLKTGKYIKTVPNSQNITAVTLLKDNTLVYANIRLWFYGLDEQQRSIPILHTITLIFQSSNGTIFFIADEILQKLVGNKVLITLRHIDDVNKLIEIQPNQLAYINDGVIMVDMDGKTVDSLGIDNLNSIIMLNSKNYVGISKNQLIIGENTTFTSRTLEMENPISDVVGDDTETSVLVCDDDSNIFTIDLESLDVIKEYYHHGLILKMVKPY